MQVLLITLHTLFSYSTSLKNLLKDQDILSLVIISFIPVTCMFDQVTTLRSLVKGCQYMNIFKTFLSGVFYIGPTS